MNILTTAAESYMTTFSGYANQFLQWGQWIFFSLLVMNIVWMTLWCAFDRHAFSESMPSFIKKFFVITLFYTIMINPGWLGQILKTAQFILNSAVEIEKHNLGRCFYSGKWKTAFHPLDECKF